jgi:Tfp pilus assembly protein PilF
MLILAAVAFVLAMLAKPGAAVAPVIAGILDWLIMRRPLRRVWPAVLVGALLALPLAVIVNRTQHAAFVPDVPLHLRPVVAADTIAFALAKIAWPFRLAVDYGRSPTWLMNSPQRAFTWIVVALLLAMTLWMWRRRRDASPWAMASLLLLAAGMAPYLGMVKFDFQYDSTFADRYAYLGMFGVALAVAFALSARPTRGAYAAVACAIVIFAIRSVVQAGVWRDTRSLMGATLATNPHSYVAHNILGFLDARDRNLDDAIAHDRAALRTQPHDAAAHYNLANALFMRSSAPGELEEAVEHYRAAAASVASGMSPYPPPAAMVQNNLAAALARLGRLDEAEQAYRAALALDPNLELAQRGLARVRSQKSGQSDPASR